MPCAATKSSSLTRAGCAGRWEMTQPSGRFHRCTDLCPRVTLAGSASSVSVRCRFHTCRPVYRGFSGADAIPQPSAYLVHLPGENTNLDT